MTVALGTIRQAGRWAIVEPLRAALAHGNQALVTSAAAYMSAQFAMQHDVLPPEVAWPLAVGYEWTYLRGLSSATQTRTRWTMALNLVAFATSIIGGILYCLGRYEVIPDAVAGAGAFWLAVAHVAPMAAMSLCSAMVHRAHSLERQADARRAAEAERDRQLRLQAERDAIALEQERRRAELATWEEGQRIKARVRAEQSDSVRGTVQPSVQSASGRQTNSTREQQREHILRVFAEHPKPNKSELAKQLGIGRTTLYALIDELRAEGKL